MIHGTIYRHFNGNEYIFNCIALPLNSISHPLEEEVVHLGTARYHEDTQDIKLYSLKGIVLIDADSPHVIYMSSTSETNKIWAREVDNFFGYKDTGENLIKRYEFVR